MAGVPARAAASPNLVRTLTAGVECKWGDDPSEAQAAYCMWLGSASPDHGLRRAPHHLQRGGAALA
eukprot:1477973-Heterocapsa_arctica.AAC.1